MITVDAYHWLLRTVSQLPITERLFLASVELTVLAAVVGVASAMFRARWPRLVALLWVIVLAKPLCCLVIPSPLPLVSLSYERVTTPSVAPTIDEPFAARVTPPVVDVDLREVVASEESPLAATHPCLEPAAPPAARPQPDAGLSAADRANTAAWLAVIWLTGSTLLLTVVAWKQLVSYRILRRAASPDERLNRLMSSVATELGVQSPPELRVTDQLDSPALAGITRPMVLMPRWLAADRAAHGALTWSLRHELMHWKQGDLPANALSQVVRALFFFHPLAWWAARQWRIAMEMACDRALVNNSQEAKSYAQGLYYVLSAIHKPRRAQRVGELFATQTQIGKRIELLLLRQGEGRSCPAAAFPVLLVLAATSLATGSRISRADGPAASAAPETAAFDPGEARNTGVPNPEQRIVRKEHVTVEYDEAASEYAEAIAQTVAVARDICAEQFNFDMPAVIRIRLRVDPQAKVRLFNDGDHNFVLTVRSERDLRRPAESGRFHLYGLCHEVGHLAMYRPIQQRAWLTSAAAEGWAHYIGSRLVDEVYRREGPQLWPDSYDYLSDGTQRLQRQLLSSASRPTVAGAGLWKQLADVVGDTNIAPIFAAWGQSPVDTAAPADELRRRLTRANAAPQVAAWWQRAANTLVAQRPRSQFVAVQAPARMAAAPAAELKADDGRPAGKQSLAGSGHAVRFRADQADLYLTSVQIHGARYGAAMPPNEDFHVWLCDKDFREVAVFEFPYAHFERGSAKWVRLSIPPTKVPPEFFVCVGFSPSATKGVFVSRDAAGSGQSATGLPGRPARAYSAGDWLIRATLSRVSTTRTWTDSSGQFRLRAELVGVVDGNVQLKKEDGSTITVPLDKLSEADRKFIAAQRTPAQSPSSGAARELKSDDGKPAGRRSFPQGFAVAFTAPSNSARLTSVRLHGSRYGAPGATRDPFRVAICDRDFKLIKSFTFPYGKFARGEAKWVTLPVKPTDVPKQFVICVDFRPTSTKGVYLSHDEDGRGLMGTPGRRVGSFGGGDWLLRAVIEDSPPR